MKLKLLTIGIILIMVSSTFLANAELKDNNNIEKTLIIETKEIHVAIYTDFKDEEYFMLPLKNYNWQVGNTRYYFVPNLITTKDILKGKLNIKNYDVLIYSFNQADSYLFNTGFSNLPKNKIVVRNIANFIKDGGGYYGSCGGAAIAGGMKNKPKTFLERAMYESSLGISDVEFEYNTAIPLVTDLMKRGPESVDLQAYLLYSGWYIPNPHDMNYSGYCPDVNISEDSPIFNDFVGNTRKIHWISLTALEVPEHPDREITVLARFPDEEISDNLSTQIHYWTYTGGIRGLIKGLLNKGEINFLKNLGILMRPWLFSEDWEKTNIIIESHVANKPFMTAEIYPNENKARIVRCSGHPELVTWWGGHLQDMEDTDNNNLYKGFYKLVDAIPLNDTIEDEITYNYCIIRRIAAWEAKIPDNDLPPVYGPSQVSNIYPFIQNSSTFKIIGNAETSDGIASLDLYYRYSNDNTSWNNWTLYGTDTGGSDGWSWSFNAPNGTGYYQFYSIRNVKYEDHTETETAPPGSDAIAKVVL
jgi:hypothetical protein